MMIKVGKITKEQQRKMYSAIRREDELFEMGGNGFKSTAKTHKTDKDWTRKPKFKKNYEEFDY